jgi:DNA replication protein DnaC
MNERQELAEAYSREHIHSCSCLGRKFVRFNFPVAHELFGAAIPCICQRDSTERDRAKRLIARSGIRPEEFSRWDFNSFNPSYCIPEAGKTAKETLDHMAKVKASCERYAIKPKCWLILQGQRGAGKSHLAYAIAERALGNGVSVFCHNVPELLDMLRAGYSDSSYNDMINDLMNVELLVLDDLGAQANTDWTAEKLYEIINHRSRRLLPMVITTNANLDDDACGIDPRILSRLRDGSKAGIEGLVHILRMPVADYRPMNRAFATKAA